MPYKALSERVKACNKADAKEKKLNAAVDAYRLDQAKPQKSRKGARSIAKEYGIDGQWRTILHRYKGGKSLREGHEGLQKLTPAEEVILAES